MSNFEPHWKRGVVSVSIGGDGYGAGRVKWVKTGDGRKQMWSLNGVWQWEEVAGNWFICTFHSLKSLDNGEGGHFYWFQVFNFSVYHLAVILEKLISKRSNCTGQQ